MNSARSLLSALVGALLALQGRSASHPRTRAKLPRRRPRSATAWRALDGRALIARGGARAQRTPQYSPGGARARAAGYRSDPDRAQQVTDRPVQGQPSGAGVSPAGNQTHRVRRSAGPAHQRATRLLSLGSLSVRTSPYTGGSAEHLPRPRRCSRSLEGRVVLEIQP